MKRKIILVLSLIIGPIFSTIAFSSIIIPNNLIGGGLSGIALLLNKATGLNMQLLLAGLFLPIAVWAFLKFGIKQIITASVSFILFTGYLGIVSKIVPPLITDSILAAIFSGILFGISGGIVLRLGVSNGPESLIGIYLKEKFNIPIGTFLTIFNSLIIMMSLLSTDITMALYSTISIYMSGKVTNFIILGFGRYFEMNIITSKYLELTEYIHKEIKRGVTYIQCIGTYELKKNMMVKTLVKNDEVIKVKNYLKTIDPESFIYITESAEVHGRGFSD